MKKTVLSLSLLALIAGTAWAAGPHAPLMRRPIPVCADETGCMDENPADIRVTGLTPPNGADGVSPHTALVIAFSRDMAPGAGSAVLKRKSDGSVAFSLDAGAIAVSGNEALLQFPQLAEGENYYVEIPPGVLKSVDGYSYAGFSGSATWSFATADISAPALVLTDPDNGETGVALNADLILSMSENVQAGSGSIEIRKVSDGSLFDSIPVSDPAVSFLGDAVDIDPATSFEENTLYTVIIPSGAIVDGAGHPFAGLVAGEWQFRSFNSNFPPTVANPISDASGTEGAAFSFTFPANAFADSDDLTYSATGLPAWLSFDGAARTFSGTPGASDAGETGITVTATDTLGQSVFDTFALTIADNPPPAVANPISDASGTEGAAFSFTFPANAFADGDTLAYSATGLPAWLSFDGAARTFSGTPGASDAGSADIVVTATDPLGQTASDTFTLAIADNPAPAAGTAIPAQNATTGTAFSYAIPADAFSDTETPVLSATLADGSDLPVWLTFDAGTLEGLPASSDVGTYSIRITATDSAGQTASQTFNLVVAVANNTPVLMAFISPPPPATIEAGGTFSSGPFLIKDGDGQPMAVIPSFTQDGGLSSVNFLSATIIANHPAATSRGANYLAFLSGNLGNPSETGTSTISFVANDGIDSSAPMTFLLTVIPFNPPPTVANPLADGTGVEGTAYSFTFPANTFADNDALTYSVAGLPAWLSFTGATRTFSGMPGIGDSGVSSITVTATDVGGKTVADTFTLTIADNPAPTVGTAIPAQNMTTGVAFNYVIPAGAFADTESLAFSATLASGAALPVWLGFDEGTRTLAGLAASSDVGTYSIKIIGTDSVGQTAFQTFNVVVAQPPAVISLSPASATMTITGGNSPGNPTSFTVSNCSGCQTTSAISASLSSGTNFEISSNGCTTLAGGASCTVAVRPIATANGTLASSVLTVSAVSGGSKTSSFSGSASGFDIFCWGINSKGVFGNGTGSNSSTPINVNWGGSVSGWAAGYQANCAIMGGALKCWGGNAWGQVGDGTMTDRYVPTSVSGMDANVTAVAVSNSDRSLKCGVKNGAVKCWGCNLVGGLGNNSTTDSSVPVDVSGISSGATAVAVGAYHSCAIVGGGLKCWGNNGNGQLGDGSTTNRLVPVSVSGMGSNVTAVAAAGFVTCAIQSGAVKCWGYVYPSTPTAISGLGSGVTALSAGASHICAIKDGAVYCWGAWGTGAILGDGTTTNTSTPVAATGLGSGVTALAAGSYDTCAIKGGGLYCWGSTSASMTPAVVSGMGSGVNAAVAGMYFTCALRP